MLSESASSDFRRTALKVQQVFLDHGAESAEMNPVPAEHMERGVQRIDIEVKGWMPKIATIKSKLRAAGTLLDEHFKRDAIDEFWEGFNESDDALINIGVDTDDRNIVIGVELKTQEFLDAMMGETRETKVTSFKKFLAEARKAGVAIEEKKTKGQVDKLIATLEGHEAGIFTKLARQYHAISKALDKLEGKKKELNAALKGQVGSIFDPELDKYLTRVVQSTKFAATLARETPMDEVKEKIEVDYEKLVHGLMSLISEELKPAADELVKGATRKWKPDPKSPNLLVKPLDEGVADTLAGWWRAAKEKLAKHLARFDKGLASLEKQLAKLQGKPVTESVQDWREIDDVEELMSFATDHLSDEDSDELMDRLQGLHVEDEDDHDEAMEIISNFLEQKLK